jgi:hypothetical protein
MTDILIKYVRHNNNEPYGVVVTNGKEYGISLCDPNDRFCKKTGKELALQHLRPLEEVKLSLLTRMKSTFNLSARIRLTRTYASIVIMEDRAFRYFVAGPAMKSSTKEEVKA